VLPFLKAHHVEDFPFLRLGKYRTRRGCSFLFLLKDLEIYYLTIQSLIPHSHYHRATLTRQIQEVRISVATNVSQIFQLKLDSGIIYGDPVRGQVALSKSGDHFHLFMTEDCANAECAPYDLVRILADACEIKDPNHYSLLCTALSNSSVESIAAAFTQQGIDVKGIAFGMYPLYFGIIPELIKV
jgi:hypothetical protein